MGYDPTTYRLTAGYSTTELLGQVVKWYAQLDSNQHNPVTVLCLGGEAGMSAFVLNHKDTVLHSCCKYKLICAFAEMNR